MTGAYSITYQKELSALGRLLNNLLHPNLTGVRLAAENDIDRNFETQGGNIGLRWAPTIMGNDPLQRTGRLRKAVRSQQIGSTVQVTVERMEKGVDIAPIQNYGARIKVTDRMRAWLAFNLQIFLRATTTHIVIPAREFFRLSAKGVLLIIEQVYKAVMP